MKKLLLILLLTYSALSSEISLQILGSGGPESGDRASASYLIKKDGKATILVDFGGGSFLHFGQAKAKIEDLRAVLFTHLHIDHVVELPALLKAGYFSKRNCTLDIIGPRGNKFFPGFNKYINLQFGKHGAYRYMSDILTDESDSFTLHIMEVPKDTSYHFKEFDIKAVYVNHGIVPALAYKITIDDKTIVFSGDTSAESDKLIKLSMNADILVAHHAIPENGYEGAAKLHMKPSRIAQIATQANIKKLILSHRMKRTFKHEKQTQEIISKKFKGHIIWAEDLMEVKLP